MKIKFKQGVNLNQEFLFPKKVTDYLPDNHLAKTIREIVDRLNLSVIQKKYSDIGQHAYDPKTMVSLIFYGYSIGVRSSRKISQACEERFDFIFLSDGLKPSHDRISDFRKDNFEELKDIFKIIVLVGANLGLAKLGNIKVSIDGAKIKANASSKLTKDEKGLVELIIKTDEEINKMLKEAEEIDNEEDKKYGKENRGNELPKKLQSKLSRKIAIEEAYEKLKQQKEEMKNKIIEEKGRGLIPTEEKKIEKMKINITDNDAKFMKERCGVIKPNYNAQISVDEKNQFIIANDVTDECNDTHQLVPMLEKTKENVNENPKSAKADNGYFPQLEKAKKQFPETNLYIDDRNRRKENIDMKEIKKEYSKIQYDNLKKLLTKKGEKEYKKRMHTAEPPIGNMKHNLGYRYFLVRGTDKVQGEFNLMCVAHNVKKIHKHVVEKNKSIAVAMQNIRETTRFGVNNWIKSEKRIGVLNY